MQKWKINDSYISKAQGSQLVPPLSPTPWALASRRDDEIRDVLERYMYYHRKIRQTCRSCQINKRHSQKYGHPPPKLVITTHWKALCVDLIGPYTLKGKDGSGSDFMCLTMINPATSWFEIVELPTVAQETTVPPAGKGKKVTFDNNTKVAEPYFDKSSAQISNLVYKTWFSKYPRCQCIIYNNEANSNFTSDPYTIHMR